MLDTQSPSLNKYEQVQAVKIAVKIHNLYDMKKRLAYITALVSENIRLTKECNDLRDRLGLPQMPTHPLDESVVG